MLRRLFSRRRRCRSTGLVLASGWSVQYDRCELNENHEYDCFITTLNANYVFWHEVHDETHFALEWNDIFGKKCKSLLVLTESEWMQCELRRNHSDHYCGAERGISVIRWQTIWRQVQGEYLSNAYPGREQ